VTRFFSLKSVLTIKREHWIQAVSLLAVALYAYAIEHFYGWQQMLAAWRDIALWKIGAALVLIFFTYLVRGLRIHYYLLPLTKNRLGDCLKIMLLHNLLNNLLPMRTGEASFPLMMRSYFGLPLAGATAGLVFLRLLDLQVLLCIGGFAVITYVGASSWLWWCLPPLILSPLIVLPCAPLLSRWQEKLAAGNHQGKLQKVLNQLLVALPSNFVQLLFLWGYTWLCWATKIGVFTLVLLWFADTTWQNALGAAFGGELSSVIPIHTPGGLGTYEASMLGTARLFGIEGDWVLFAAVQLHLMILLSTLLGGLVAQVFGRASSRNLSSA